MRLHAVSGGARAERRQKPPFRPAGFRRAAWFRTIRKARSPDCFYIRMRNSQKPAGLRPGAKIRNYRNNGRFRNYFYVSGPRAFCDKTTGERTPAAPRMSDFFILPPARARTNTLRLMAKRRIEGQTAAGFSHSYIECVRRQGHTFRGLLGRRGPYCCAGLLRLFRGELPDGWLRQARRGGR